MNGWDEEYLGKREGRGREMGIGRERRGGREVGRQKIWCKETCAYVWVLINTQT